MSQACARLLCCERSSWQTTAMPVGMCVRRTADSVLLTCWPPAPCERMVSMRTSDFVDVDLDAVVDHRIDRDAGKRRVPPRVGIERRDAHQPVHAGFGLQPAVGVVALDLDGRRLDAGLFALRLFQHTRPCSRAARPSACTCATACRPSPGSRCRRRRHGLRDRRRWRRPRRTAAPPARAAPTSALSLLERLFGLGDDLLILLGLAELDQHELIVELALDAADGGELVLERGALLHHALGARGVVPEVGVFGELVQLGEARLRLCRSQRCLLSSPTDRLMSSTSFSVSARMADSLVACGCSGCGRKPQPALDCARGPHRTRLPPTPVSRGSTR